MSAIADVIANAPALIVGLVVAVCTLLGTFGVPLTDGQTKAIVGLVTAALALAGALLVHRSTTPNRQVDAIVRTVAAPQPAPTPEAVGQ